MGSRGVGREHPSAEFFTAHNRLYNMHFRILKMIATSVVLTALECTKFVFDRVSAPDPAEKAYSVPQTLSG